ncbi:MAG: hypothetical protein JWP00_3456 [Chloroflexi bacterium]|jgi:hypothetical protein|nr:hypothetical protein [Chloroflexota bacterium]
MSNRFNSTLAFQEFIEKELQHVVDRFNDLNATVYLYCHVKTPDETARRVLIIAEAQSTRIVVSVEAAYQVFEGDIHHVLQVIGGVDRSEVAGKLLPLLGQAYEVAIAWKPTFADVEELFYLSS